MNKYSSCFATSPIGTSGISFPIDEKRAFRVVQAFRTMNLVALVEERFDFVVQNYISFESECLAVSLHASFNKKNEIEGLFEIQRKVDRQFANLLSSLKMYIDHLKSNLSKNHPVLSSEVVKRHKQLIKTNISYSLICFLRDISQHKTLPFGFEVMSSIPQSPSYHRVGARFALTLLTNQVTDDSRIDKSIKSFLTTNQNLKLNEHIRVSVNCIAELHEYVRAELEGQFSASRNELEMIFKDYAAADSGYDGRVQNAISIFGHDGHTLPDEVGSVTDFSLRNATSLRERYSILKNVGYRIVDNDF